MADSESDYKSKKGFAGLDSLVSDITASTKRMSPSAPPKVPSPGPVTSPAPPRPVSLFQSSYIQPAQTSGSGRLTFRRVVGWGIFVGAVIALYAWVFVFDDGGVRHQSNNPAPSYSTSSSPAPSSDTASPPTPDPYLQMPVVAEQNNTSTVPEDSPAPTYSPSTPALTTDTASPPESASNSQMPSVGQNNILSVQEFYWCKKETIRLDAIKSVMDNTDPQQTIRFRAMMNNFDSRCAQNHYRNGDLEVVERELAQEKESIAAEAKSEWFQDRQ